jgi:methylated-DNA-[protein]-cysteine S-methyltransferase
MVTRQPEPALWTAEAFLDPLGWVGAAVSQNGLRSLSFQSGPQGVHPGPAGNPGNLLSSPADLALQALDQVREYLAGGRRCFEVPIDWAQMRPFQQQVLRFTAAIPFGEVRTYGQLASSLGQPGGSRAVGAALGANPIPIIIPCHRVIGGDRRLHGFSAPDGIETKAWLLRLEGHSIINHRMVVGNQGQYEFRF